MQFYGTTKHFQIIIIKSLNWFMKITILTSKANEWYFQCTIALFREREKKRYEKKRKGKEKNFLKLSEKMFDLEFFKTNSWTFLIKYTSLHH